MIINRWNGKRETETGSERAKIEKKEKGKKEKKYIYIFSSFSPLNGGGLRGPKIERKGKKRKFWFLKNGGKNKKKKGNEKKIGKNEERKKLKRLYYVL